MRFGSISMGSAVWVLILSALPLHTPSFAQVRQLWDAHYNGTGNGPDYGRDMKIDGEGNVYLTGTSMGNGTGWDIVTVKYDARGIRQWAPRFNGRDNGDDWGYSLALDTAGNVYVTGSSYATATGKDFVTIKYNNRGERQWARFYNGPDSSIDEAAQVVVDGAGNAIVTGSSQGVNSLSDYATVKYSPSGEQLWVARYNGPADDVDEGRALAVDAEGNVFVGGGSIGDSTSDYDYATIKYNRHGEEQWVERYDGPGHGYDVVYYAGSVVVDASGDVIVTGYSTGSDSTYDYATLKYDTSGNLLWEERYNGSGQGTDYADALAVDPLGNVYVTGASFDSTFSYDYLTIKYNSEGLSLWKASYNGTGNDWDEAYGIAVDSVGNVFITGRSVGATTFADFVTVMYSSGGEEQWNVSYDGTAHNFDWPFRLQLDSFQNIYVAGWSTESGTGADYTVIKYEYAPIAANHVGVNPAVQDFVQLEQNYPNPFNAATVITYMLPVEGRVRLTICDALGRKLMTLLDGHQMSGSHSVAWDAGSFASGIYLCKIEVQNTTYGKSMILLK